MATTDVTSILLDQNWSSKSQMATPGNGRCPNVLNDGVLTFEDGDATHWIPSERNPLRTLTTNEIIACPWP